MQLSQTAKKLTSQYMNNTLAAGDYYFMVSNCKPCVGTYYPVDETKKDYRLNNNLPAPQAQIISKSGWFVGNLITVTILARVPDYENLTEEQRDGFES